MSEISFVEPAPWEEEFIDAFLHEYGTLTRAAKSINLDYNEVKEHSKKSPQFRAKLEAARNRIKDTVRYEIIRRALEPIQKPIYQRGILVGYETQWDNKHLEWVAERLMPEEFHLQTRIEFAGERDGAINFKLELGDGTSKEPEKDEED